MKIPKTAIGKLIAIKWKDPTASERRQSIKDAPEGLKALSSWWEYGRVDSIKDGVVRFRQSEGYSDNEPGGEPDEAFFGWVLEELIDDYKFLVFEGERHEQRSSVSAHDNGARVSEDGKEN